MAKVSVLIPARNEKFLVPTIDDIFRNARGDIEVIVVLDGYKPDPMPEDRSNLILIHRPSSRGMRPGINSAANVATGDYLMKCDAHCAFAEGFDLALSESCEDNWVVIPRRYSLDEDNWERKRKPPIDYHYLSYPFLEGNDGALHGRWWRDRGKERAEIMIDDEMTSQGSCWFMSRKHWEWLGGLQVEGYGDFIQEFQEIGCKTWLGGGEVKVNKNTWYAHLHKGKRHGRGYFISRSSWQRGLKYSTDLWLNNKWEGRVHDFEWLIERFWPVPTWPDGWREKLGIEKKEIVTVSKPVIHESEWVRKNLNPKGEESPVLLEKFGRKNLAKVFHLLGYKKGAEVGVAGGRFSKTMCERNPGVELLCVDAWSKYKGNRRGGPQSQHDRNHMMAERDLARFNTTLIQGFSMDAVRDVPLESLDFVYIDANHDFDYVMQDIIEWAKRVRRGGIVSGHDYYHFRNSGVVEAVDAYVLTHGITEWFLTREKEKSWFWVKQ